MEFPVCGETLKLKRKPHIKKGYYKGQLVNIKMRQKDDGTIVEGKYGKQVVLLFKIYGQDSNNFIQSDGNDIIIPTMLYCEYKQDNGTYRTAVTPNSKITKIFSALGWKFDVTSTLKPMDFIGKCVELNIDDYDAKVSDVDGKEIVYKASTVVGIKKWENEERNEGGLLSSSFNTVTKEMKEAQIKRLNEMKENNAITEKGYEMALEQINKQRVI